MTSFLQNRAVQIVGGSVLAILAILIIASVILASLNSARSRVSFESAPGAPYGDGLVVSNRGYVESEIAYDDSISYYPTPSPSGGYTSDLELYETTDYYISGSTKLFDKACDALTAMKGQDSYHFKTLSESLNRCSATFYVEDELAGEVVEQFEQYSGVSISRNTSSVTRHRQQLESRADVLRRQLASVESTLSEAETGMNEIVEFARNNKDAVTLSEAVRSKLSLIDELTQRKILLTSQLDDIYQQAADLNERIDVTQFSVTINRLYPQYPEQKARQWEKAWRSLSDAYTETLIGLSAFFGIFVLWAIRISVYLLVVIVLVRALFKFIRFIWKY